MSIETINIEIKSNAESQISPMKALRKEMMELKNELLLLDQGTEDYNKVAQQLANNQKRLKDIQEEARFAAADLGEQLATTNRIATGLVAGFNTVSATVALFGGESENLEKIMVRLQSGIAIVQGLQGLEGLARDLEIAKIQFRGATSGVKTFIAGLSGLKKAIASTGIGALVVVIGLLISKYMEWKEKQDALAEETEKLQLEQEKLNKTFRQQVSQVSSKNIVSLLKLSEAYKELGDNVNEKNKFIQSNTEELKKMGIEVNNVNDADRVFITNTDDYVNAIIARAKAEATLSRASKIYEEYLIKRQEIEAKTNDRKNQDISNYDDAQAIEYWKQQTKLIEEINNAAIENLEKETNEQIKNLIQLAQDLNTQAGLYLNFDKTIVNDDDVKSQDELTQKLIELRNEVYLNTLSQEEREIEIIKQKYAEKYKLAKGDLELTKALKEQEERDIIDIYTKEFNDNIDLPSIDEILKLGNKDISTMDESALENLKYNYDLQQSILESALQNELITQEEYKKKKLEITQNFADKEIEINKKIQEDEEDRKEKSIKTITSAFSAASSIISEIQAGIDIVNEDSFEKNKKLQIANATIQMLAGITTALSGAFTTKTGPWDMVLAGIQAATIATTGAIQIANIKNQTYDSEKKPEFSTPNVSGSILPTEIYGTQLSNQANYDLNSSIKDTRVYVVESDITNAQDTVKTQVDESVF